MGKEAIERLFPVLMYLLVRNHSRSPPGISISYSLSRCEKKKKKKKSAIRRDEGY